MGNVFHWLDHIWMNEWTNPCGSESKLPFCCYGNFRYSLSIFRNIFGNVGMCANSFSMLSIVSMANGEHTQLTHTHTHTHTHSHTHTHTHTYLSIEEKRVMNEPSVITLVRERCWLTRHQVDLICTLMATRNRVWTHIGPLIVTMFPFSEVSVYPRTNPFDAASIILTHETGTKTVIITTQNPFIANFFGNQENRK